MAIEQDSAGARVPLPFLYLGALLLELAMERFVAGQASLPRKNRHATVGHDD